jgi:hypothetical protein
MKTFRLLEAYSGIPLCVDLDGTLHRGDCSWISFKLALALRPLAALRALLLWPWVGRAQFKNTLAMICKPHFPWHKLHWNTALLNKLKELQANHPLILVSGTSHDLLNPLPEPLKIFDQVLGTQKTNLIAAEKARTLRTKFPQGFVYIGNSRADIEVWKTSTLGFSVVKDHHGNLLQVRLADASWNSFAPSPSKE